MNGSPDSGAPDAPVLIVSNRLPVIASVDAGQVRLADASGGLATGLSRWHASRQATWIGWPGDTSRWSTAQRDELARLLAARRCAPVALSDDLVDRYYHGFANRVLWPLLHYLIDRVPVGVDGWSAYVAANEAFADAIVDVYQPGQRIWVHDYHLMLLPALLRARLPSARIGFFLHVPFPSSEVFRALPWRREILHGLLGADLVGFHTFPYLRHFVSSLLHVAGVESAVDCVRWESRDVRLGVFPMGIDAARFADLAAQPEVSAAAAAIRDEARGRKLILGIDRLDYTKGIPRRMCAVERVLTDRPELRDRIRYVQVAVPSRDAVDAYQAFRHDVERTVGRINGECSTIGAMPVHYIHRAVTMEELAALYAAADVMLVTPLRDGMNLVAKEFIASRCHDDGVLILSESAGAAAELADALVVNPYDVDAIAAAIVAALEMKDDERRERMQRLRRRVSEWTVFRWADAFVTALDAAPRRIRRHPAISVAIDTLRSAASTNRPAHLLLDYDGTLVPLAASPELAAPDDALIALLLRLSRSPDLHLHIVSGRPRQTLDDWFGAMAVTLWAEHGFWCRLRGTPWRAAFDVQPDWPMRVLPILEQFTTATAGTWIERKTASLVWHYRGAPPDFGSRQAHELRMLLGDLLSNQPLEVLEGHMVIEVRVRGVTKAAAAHHLLRAGIGPDGIAAFGDDRTDEDLFTALPEGSVAVAVGGRLAGATHVVEDHRAVRVCLAQLVSVAQERGVRSLPRRFVSMLRPRQAAQWMRRRAVAQR